jgi:hypothetical protein
MQNIREEFERCSGSALPRRMGECSATEIEALQANSPAAVFTTYTNWVFSPASQNVTNLPVTDAAVGAAAGESCYVCIEHYYTQVRDAAMTDSSLSTKCKDKVTSEACIEALAEEIGTFKDCAGYDIITEDMLTTQAPTTTSAPTTTAGTTTGAVSYSSVIMGSLATSIAVIGSLIL